MRWIRPHHVAGSVHDVDYDSLVQQGVRAILYDLENTLCRWRVWEIDPPTWALLDRLAQQHLGLSVLTNAFVPPDHLLAQGLRKRGIVLVSSAHKPLQRGFRVALDRLGVHPHQATMVGDQLLTDILGGRRAGLITVLVDPLGSEESLLTKLNRRLERLLGRPISAGTAPRTGQV